MVKPEAMYSTQARKKSVTLNINSDLVEKARALNINLSKTLENSLIELLRKTASEDWRKANKGAIAEYNKRVKKEGVFSDGLKTF